MSRTPLSNRMIPDGKERTPLANRTLKEHHGDHHQPASIDHQLLDILRSLNLAVAAVAHARDQRFHEAIRSRTEPRRQQRSPRSLLVDR